MKVLLLGATGLLGHNVIVELVEQGHSVRALVRDARRFCLPDDLQRSAMLDIVQSSNFDEQTLLAAANGCDAIINCAAATDMSLLHYEDFRKVNVGLPKRLVEVMQRTNISTLVQVSTANTVGIGHRGKPANEDCEIEFPFSDSWYAQSKLETEQMLCLAAKEHPQWHLIIVNPGFMIGPFDTKPSSGELLLAAYRRRLMVVPKGGGKSFVAAVDVAAAAVNALTKGESGKRYLLTGQSLTLKEFYSLQADCCGYKQKVLTLPRWMVLSAGAVGDVLRFLGIRTQLSLRNVRQLMVEEHYDNSRAVNVLSMPQTPLDKAIEQFFVWRQK